MVDRSRRPFSSAIAQTGVRLFDLCPDGPAGVRHRKLGPPGEGDHALASGASRGTAVFASNDRQARQVLQICQLAKIGIPSDVAVLGCDNDELLCENTTPTLSSVEPDFTTCGYRAAQLLEALMFRRGRSPQYLLYGVARVVERESGQFRARASDGRVSGGLDFIRLNAERSIRVPDVARHMRVSRRMAELLFRNHLDRSIAEEIQRARVEKMKRFLSDTGRPITMVCDACGYQSEAHAKRLFKRATGQTMGQYRKACWRVRT